MTDIRCIIVEDEPLARERTTEYIRKLPFLHLEAVFDNGIDALLFLRSNDIDLLFLDIHMGEFSGIQLLETANANAQVIITTAYPEYALKGFELRVTDYLLKPYTFERFYQAVERVRQQHAREEKIQERSFLFVKTEYRLEKIGLNDIVFIEGMRDYRRIHTLHKRIMTLQTFRDLEQELPPHIVCRVHKSFMVALGKIDSIEKDRIYIKDKVIPVSDTYKKRFLEQIRRG